MISEWSINLSSDQCVFFAFFVTTIAVTVFCFDIKQLYGGVYVDYVQTDKQGCVSVARGFATNRQRRFATQQM